MTKDHDIKIIVKDIKIKIKFQDHMHAKGTSKKFPRRQGSKVYDVTRSDPDRDVPDAEYFHEQIDDELNQKEAKHIEADDQAIHIILMGLPKDIYDVNGNGNVVAARAKGNGNGNNAEKFDLMVAASDINEIEEVNTNYILMANLQQASTLGTQTDKAPVYDLDGLAEEPTSKGFPNSTSFLGSLKLELQGITSGRIISGLDLTYAPSTITSQKPTEHELGLLFEAMYYNYIGGQPLAALRTAHAASAPQIL
nr:hypothetical protein [Tanacetum cinerariifolium]